MNPIQLSLVTGVRNRPEGLSRLIRSIVRYTDVSWELIVADASDVAITVNDPRVRILPERPRLGYTKGYNRACREARGEWVLYLNDDAEVCEFYASKAISFMETHPKIGLGALLFSTNGSPFCVYHQPFGGMIYANFGIIRRTLGDSIGWFPEAFPMYGSDNALAFEVLLAGYGIEPIPEAKILHHEVWDDVRRENQIGRGSEPSRLLALYGLKLFQLQNTYRLARVSA